MRGIGCLIADRLGYYQKHSSIPLSLSFSLPAQGFLSLPGTITQIHVGAPFVSDFRFSSLLKAKKKKHKTKKHS